jgi:NADH-ubiquinone oxidoreductase chain 1
VCRLPFDFFEGESELVSGFNIEYNSLYFMYIYMVEYIDIFFICYFVVILFFNIDVLNIIFYLFILINLFLVIWIRGTYVRFRYDKIIILM